jgi:hypothetical protein
MIALEHHGGMKICARLLCDDPSCHLRAIILVNMTFAHAEWRKEFVLHSGIGLVGSLALTLGVASLTSEGYNTWLASSIPLKIALRKSSTHLNSVG